MSFTPYVNASSLYFDPKNMLRANFTDICNVEIEYNVCWTPRAKNMVLVEENVLLWVNATIHSQNFVPWPSSRRLLGCVSCQFNCTRQYDHEWELCIGAFRNGSKRGRQHNRGFSANRPLWHDSPQLQVKLNVCLLSQVQFFSKKIKKKMYSYPKNVFLIIETTIFLGDLSDISVRTATLVVTTL